MSEYRASLFRNGTSEDASLAASPSLERLRVEIARIERAGAAAGAPAGLPLGWETVDDAFPDGVLAATGVHEAAGPAAHGFALRILARCKGPVMWVHPARSRWALYGPGLARLGGALAGRLVVVRARSRDEGLWAAEEGLRSGALDGLALEPDGPIDLTASRRLQLAAEAGGALGLLLTGAQGGAAGAAVAPSAVASRWRIEPAPADISGPATTPRWRATLIRRRGGGSGEWLVEAPG
ncbi:MAG: hypothetical protein RIB45_09875 [Marivibrio sp.]|uniref:ImuA family protein n=1 Tax=Marivibrio sp. TaxID=2039719 RepID=UPI0032EEA290